MFESILIVGRGELGSRVERTCLRMGLELSSDESVEGAPLRPDVESVINTARASGAQAVHPGGTAPATRVAMGAAVREAGLVFVGPSAEALAVMADKPALRAAAAECGLRVVAGSPAPVTDPASMRRLADDVGYPILVKPVAGASGIGIHRADDEEALDAAVAAATTEAGESLGDGRVYFERALLRARQLEITCFVDASGRMAAFGERECSLRRNDRVVVTETPSPVLSFAADAEEQREALIESCDLLARQIGLLGMATFEFLSDIDGDLYFLEANAGMQGAMLMTEMMSGRDPIEVALRLAAGEPAEEAPHRRFSGHGFEARLCAEDVTRGFAPVGGKLEALSFPPAPQSQARMEGVVEVGQQVPPSPDGLLARVATRAPTRHQALMGLDRVLAETRVGGLATNLGFLRKALNTERFRTGQYDTSLAEALASTA